MQIQQHVGSLTQKMKGVLQWAMPMKLMLGALLGALGSAGLLGYLSEFATYSYAIHYGFRPPVEGIPYLRATIAYGSFFLLVTGALIFAISVLLIRQAIQLFLNVPLFAKKLIGSVAGDWKIFSVGDTITFLSTRPMSQIAFISIFVAAFCAIFMYGFAMAGNAIDDSAKVSATSLAASYGAFGFIVTLAISRKGAIWWMAATATIAYFILWLVVLFSPTQYSQFLRIVGHGGGMPVTIELRDPDKSASFSKQGYYLMIRSTDAFIFYSDKERRFIEVPRDQIRSVSHETGGLRGLPHKLPK